MNKVIATITKMTILTALLLAVSPQIHADELSDKVEKKIAAFDTDKESAWKEMKEFYAEVGHKGKKVLSYYDGMGWDDDDGGAYYVEYSGETILSYISKYMNILEPYGYYFYTKEKFWADTTGAETIGIPDPCGSDDTGYKIKSFLEDKFHHYIQSDNKSNIVVLKYSSSNILPYDKINIKIDKKKKMVYFYHSN